MTFHDRADAGKQLARTLEFLRGRDDLLVLAIPRGGIAVGFEIARALDAPLDLWFSHKIGAPENPEFAIGSVTSTGEIAVDPLIVQALAIPEKYLHAEAEKQREEIERRRKFYRGDAPPAAVANKTVVLVDDGLATGATALAALKSLAKMEPAPPAQLILAVPVSPPETVARLRGSADKIIALHTPRSFGAVGQFYENFAQVSDAEAMELIRLARQS